MNKSAINANNNSQTHRIVTNEKKDITDSGTGDIIRFWFRVQFNVD